MPFVEGHAHVGHVITNEDRAKGHLNAQRALEKKKDLKLDDLKAIMRRRLAEVAYQVNERTENIGARRLHTVLERLLDEISFGASDHPGSAFRIDAEYVDAHLSGLVQDEDLSRYIL